MHKLDKPGFNGLYASDGTSIRYNTVTRRVEFLDGSCFDFSQYDTLHKVVHRDRNGNEIVYEFEDLGYGRKRSVRIVDMLGREALAGWVANAPNGYNPYGPA